MHFLSVWNNWTKLLLQKCRLCSMIHRFSTYQCSEQWMHYNMLFSFRRKNISSEDQTRVDRVDLVKNIFLTFFLIYLLSILMEWLATHDSEYVPKTLCDPFSTNSPMLLTHQCVACYIIQLVIVAVLKLV